MSSYSAFRENVLADEEGRHGPPGQNHPPNLVEHLPLRVEHVDGERVTAVAVNASQDGERGPVLNAAHGGQGLGQVRPWSEDYSSTVGFA